MRANMSSNLPTTPSAGVTLPVDRDVLGRVCGGAEAGGGEASKSFLGRAADYVMDADWTGLVGGVGTGYLFTQVLDRTGGKVFRRLILRRR